jgi:flagellar biosynthesis protein FlhF
MKFKTFMAPTVKEAMRKAQIAFGDEAIILDTQQCPDSKEFRVTAALDRPLPQPAQKAPPKTKDQPTEDIYEIILSSLERHGTPAMLTDKLLRAATAIPTQDPVMALGGALNHFYSFDPQQSQTNKPKIFIGPPGTGKTITVAKFVARAVLNQQPVHVITTDSLRAGGVEQLASFTHIMNLDLLNIRSPNRLYQVLKELPKDDLIVIDTSGVNPYCQEELEELQNFIEAAQADPILILPAGGDAMEMTDIAKIFKNLKVHKFIVTRIDVVKRLGSILMCGDLAKLHFSEVSLSPHIAEGLTPINPVSLARLILNNPTNTYTFDPYTS